MPEHEYLNKPGKKSNTPNKKAGSKSRSLPEDTSAPDDAALSPQFQAYIEERVAIHDEMALSPQFQAYIEERVAYTTRWHYLPGFRLISRKGRP
jgi:hypothetical protein